MPSCRPASWSALNVALQVWAPVAGCGVVAGTVKLVVPSVSVTSTADASCETPLRVSGLAASCMAFVTAGWLLPVTA